MTTTQTISDGPITPSTPRKASIHAPHGWTWWASETSHGECSSQHAARRQLAQAIGRPSLRGLWRADGGHDGEVYYFSSRAERDADDTGAWAWSICPTQREEA